MTRCEYLNKDQWGNKKFCNHPDGDMCCLEYCPKIHKEKGGLEKLLRQFAGDVIEAENFGEGYNYKSTRGYKELKEYTKFWDPDASEKKINKCSTCKHEKVGAGKPPCKCCIHNPYIWDFWEEKRNEGVIK